MGGAALYEAAPPFYHLNKRANLEERDFSPLFSATPRLRVRFLLFCGIEGIPFNFLSNLWNRGK
jgi:hypothetical protein